jgi:hypothetical protein
MADYSGRHWGPPKGKQMAAHLVASTACLWVGHLDMKMGNCWEWMLDAQWVHLTGNQKVQMKGLSMAPRLDECWADQKAPTRVPHSALLKAARWDVHLAPHLAWNSAFSWVHRLVRVMARPKEQ